MHVAVYLPLLLSAVFGAAAPRLVRKLPPAWSTWLLSAGAVLAAAAACTALALLAFPVVAQTRLLTARGHWSDVVLRRQGDVAAPIALAALAFLGLVLGLAIRTLVRQVISLRRSVQLATELLPGARGLVVVDDPRAEAFALPGWPGRIVVTSGMLRALGAEERRALLAHERSHLDHRHYLHQSVTAVAVSLNPMLRLIPAALALACERWADEDAAACSRRVTVADALTRAALLRPAARPVGGGVLAATANDVAARVLALRAPAERVRAWRVAVLGALLLGAVVAALLAAQQTEDLFELAQAAYRASGRG